MFYILENYSMTTINSVDNDGVANPIFLSDSHKETSTIPCSPGLESDKAKVNLEEPKKKEDNVWTNALRGKWVTLQKTNIMPLIVSICIMAVIFQIPLILYCTDPPSTDVTSLLDSVDLETCSVSSMKLKIHNYCDTMYLFVIIIPLHCPTMDLQGG